MAEQDIRFFNKLSTPEGEIAFGDVMKNNAKMAVMSRRIFPSSKKFAMSHSIGLQMTGALDGAIINNAPSVYSILCGEKPVGPDNGAVAGIWHAKNGDIIISAPSKPLIAGLLEKAFIKLFQYSVPFNFLELFDKSNGPKLHIINVAPRSKPML